MGQRGNKLSGVGSAGQTRLGEKKGRKARTRRVGAIRQEYQGNHRKPPREKPKRHA